MVSLFSRIIAREIPSCPIYEDTNVMAFLTIEPHTPGHTLVVPKKEIGNILDIPDELFMELMGVAKNIIGPAILQATHCERVGFLVEGFGVPDHAHLHLIPLFGPGDIAPSKAQIASPESLQTMAEKIRSFITHE